MEGKRKKRVNDCYIVQIFPLTNAEGNKLDLHFYFKQTQVPTGKYRILFYGNHYFNAYLDLDENMGTHSY